MDPAAFSIATAMMTLMSTEPVLVLVLVLVLLLLLLLLAVVLAQACAHRQLI